MNDSWAETHPSNSYQTVLSILPNVQIVQVNKTTRWLTSERNQWRCKVFRNGQHFDTVLKLGVMLRSFVFFYRRWRFYSFWLKKTSNKLKTFIQESCFTVRSQCHSSKTKTWVWIHWKTPREPYNVFNAEIELKALHETIYLAFVSAIENVLEWGMGSGIGKDNMGSLQTTSGYCSACTKFPSVPTRFKHSSKPFHFNLNLHVEANTNTDSLNVCQMASAASQFCAVSILRSQ